MILQTIKKYVAIAGVVAFISLGAYTGYLKLQNSSKDSTIEKQGQQITTAVNANATLDKENKQLKKDNALNDKLLLEREFENEGLEKVYAEIDAKLKAAEDDQWNRDVLVPCTVVRGLFVDERLGCREQTE